MSEVMEQPGRFLEVSYFQPRDQQVQRLASEIEGVPGNSSMAGAEEGNRGLRINPRGEGRADHAGP